MKSTSKHTVSNMELDTQVDAHPIEAEPEFNKLVDTAISRRRFFGAGAALGLGGFFAFSATGCAVSSGMPKSKLMGFTPISTSTADTVVLPDGYQWQTLVSWGDPLFKNAPTFDPSGNAPAASQAQQFGDNTDGMSFFPLNDHRAILAINNEYTNYKHLFSHGGKELTKDDVLKAQYAHGVSIMEIERDSQNRWQVIQDSAYNRRIHVQTEMHLTGPAAGHELMKTKADSQGKVVFGTMNNCSNGQTPWGTYLTCEENFNGYFGASESVARTEEQKMYGIKNNESRYHWYKHDDRFNFGKNPNEPHRFGWIVEIDPKNPKSTPLKRTALGRFKHENVALHINKDNHVVAYMGDDERGAHIYKFVSKNKYNPNNQAANRDLLVEGTLYVAKFSMTDNKGTGEWVELTYGKNGLTKANGFADQAEVLIFARKAAKHVGATTMDRPEWVAVHPAGHQVFCTLTNNKHRGKKEGQTVGGPNPRAENHYGQIVRWTPPAQDHTATTFEWDLYLVAGNPAVHSDAYAGSSNINEANMFNSPDGIGFDQGGRLWIQTDGNYKNQGDFAGQGNNQMLCADPDTGEINRFMVGPTACEITGLAFSPDSRTMFVGIQHPDAHFPAGGDAKPRSTVIAITRQDGGIIGA
ncbi:PhoX family phosphatase [Marinomonas agarivorans]|nr:PhoX family phosphatase [Marinomonas agarivorans]